MKSDYAFFSARVEEVQGGAGGMSVPGACLFGRKKACQVYPPPSCVTRVRTGKEVSLRAGELTDVKRTSERASVPTHKLLMICNSTTSYLAAESHTVTRKVADDVKSLLEEKTDQ
eukprot:3369599-Rhodomonas_salina.1